MKTLFPIVSNWETQYHFKVEFKKWTNIQEASDYIHGTKHRKDWLVANRGTPQKNILLENLNMTCRRPKVRCSIRYSKRMARGRNIQGGAKLQNQNYLSRISFHNVQIAIANTIHVSISWSINPISKMINTKLKNKVGLKFHFFHWKENISAAHLSPLMVGIKYWTCYTLVVS